MKVLFVAPRICTPWTEGRKKFVCDLIQQTGRQWEQCGLVTIDPEESTELPANFTAGVALKRSDHLLYLLHNLKHAIDRHQPDLVLHFPFGAFTGLRGLGNLWAISRVARLCRAAAVPCCTIMYSLTTEASGVLQRWLLRDVYFNQYAVGRKRLRFGVKLPSGGPTYDPGSRTLLFMAGAAEASRERLDYVLDTRGLRLLLQAGAELVADGFRLVVAIPFLADAALLQAVRQLPDNRWSEGSIEFRAEVRVPDIYAGIAAFVFPYGQEEQQFVPTSVVEAMHFGIPVVLPRLQFLAQFYSGTAKVLVHEPQDAASLAVQICHLHTQPEQIASMRMLARDFVMAEYSIANTVSDVEAIYLSLQSNSESGSQH